MRVGACVSAPEEPDTSARPRTSAALKTSIRRGGLSMLTAMIILWISRPRLSSRPPRSS
jgi:hypothetical protein